MKMKSLFLEVSLIVRNPSRRFQMRFITDLHVYLHAVALEP